MVDLTLTSTRRAAGPVVLAVLGGALLLPQPHALAVTYSRTFEDDSAGNYSPLGGRNAEGSKLEISDEKAHEGKQSLKLTYNSTGGYIQFNVNRVERLDFVGDKLQLSMWVHGVGRQDFASGGIRLLDKNGETFQFDVPGFAEAMAKEGWTHLRAEINLAKNTGFWGDNSDGKLDRPIGFLGFAATRNAQTTVTGTVYLDDFQLTDGGAVGVAQVPVVTGVTVSIEPVLPPVTGPASGFLKWVSPPGAPVEFRTNVTLPVEAPGYTVSWKVRDAFDKVIAQGKEPLGAGERQKNLTLRVPNPPLGVLYASAVLLSPREEVVGTGESRVAVFKPRGKAVPINDFVWGVAAHVGREGGRNAADEIALMRHLGFAASRSDMTWSSIQPDANTWNWESHDKIYETFKREGIMPMPLLAYGTRWATTGDPNSADWHQWFNAPPKVDAFTTYAREAVKRYGNQTRYWEIWNEPDIDFWLGSVQQYAALVDATVPVIKAVQPEAQVMNGGFSETKRRPDFIPTYLKTVKVRPDIYAIHTHGAFENLLRAETTVNSDLAGAGLTGVKRPKVFLNEAGYSHARGIPEREQAIQLVKKMSYAPSAGFSSYIWYDLRDDGTDPAENEHNFGLVKQDYRPKASAVAANTLLETIGTRKFVRRLPLDNISYGLVYQGAGQTVLTAWRQSQSKGDAVLPLVVRAKTANGTLVKVEQRDIFGNTTPLPSQDGLFLLPLSNVPQYIVASNEGVQFELAGKNGLLMDFSPSVVVTPGEALPWQVTVNNPFPTAFKGRLLVEGTTPIAVNVAPKSSQPYKVVLQRGKTSGVREMLGLKLESEQLPAPLQGVAEVQTAHVIPAAPASLAVDIPRGGLVSLFEATPMQHLHFKDAADLSANVQMQKTERGIQVRVTATDQTHFVDAEPNMWWRGDSVQWAVGLPDGRMWEWMGALLPDGPKMVLGLAPDGKTGATLPVNIRREGTQTIYEWTLPRTLPDGTPWPERFNFDFIVNDNDGQGRKGWIEWTPGIGMEKNPAGFMPLAVQ